MVRKEGSRKRRRKERRKKRKKKNRVRKSTLGQLSLEGEQVR